MGQQMPRTLNYMGRTLNYAGRGRTPGSGMYIDHVTRVVHEMYPTQVCYTGPSYALTFAEKHQSLGKIRVDNSVLSSSVGTVNVGESLLVGPLNWAVNGPIARWAWRLATDMKYGVGRRTGFMKSVHTTGAFAFLIAEQMGMEVFGHKSQLRPGVHFAIGRRYSFILGNSGKGPAAFDIDFA
jgi:cold shock CspA family protein